MDCRHASVFLPSSGYIQHDHRRLHHLPHILWNKLVSHGGIPKVYLCGTTGVFDIVMVTSDASRGEIRSMLDKRSQTVDADHLAESLSNALTTIHCHRIPSHIIGLLIQSLQKKVYSRSRECHICLTQEKRICHVVTVTVIPFVGHVWDWAN